jgi:lipid-binding SYLF domain-containing protein
LYTSEQTCGSTKATIDLPDNIPQELLEKAECVIVIPSVKKLAFGVGASYGRGAMVCRRGETFRGPWGAPAMYALEGGSLRISNRRTSDRLDPTGYEWQRHGIDSQQQG